MLLSASDSISLLFTDDEFQQLQQTFLDRHCDVFEDAEENKLIYTDIHKQYVMIFNQSFCCFYHMTGILKCLTT